MANSEPLVDADDVTGPGAPYEEAAVKEASASIRAEAGWHIAPEMEETVQVDGTGTDVMLLPTMHVSKVVSVTDVSDPDNPAELNGWRVKRSGVLHRSRGCWPHGFQNLKVEMRHGYDECPPELLPVVAARCQQANVSAAVRQETTAGGESATYASAARSGDTDRRVQRYRIPQRP